MKKIIGTLAAATVLAAGLAAAAPPVSAAQPTYGPGMYLFTGDENANPVPLTGPIPVYPAWGLSDVPPEIHTTPVVFDGVTYNYGTIMVGSGPLPAKYGNSDYPPWWWHLSAGYGGPAVLLTYADLNSKNELIQNVTGDFQGGSQVGPAGRTANLETLPGGGTTTLCLSYVIPGQGQRWLHLNSSYDWVPDATAGC